MGFVDASALVSIAARELDALVLADRLEAEQRATVPRISASPD